MSDVEKALQEHRYEIDTLKSVHSEVVNELRDTTKAINNLATQFAVSAQKQDENAKDIDAIGKKVDQNSLKIAAMYPTYESLRGLVWKIIGALLIGMGGISAIVASIIK